MELPEAINKLATELSALPSIGPRQAARMAFHMAHRNPAAVRSLAASLTDLAGLKNCERCFFLHDNAGNLCDICSQASRKSNLIMILEKETDLVSMENTGRFKGRYLVLGQMPRTGTLTSEQKHRLKTLIEFIGQVPGGKAEEIILAFNPTTLGDFHASLIIKEIAPYAIKISRLGRGLPSGGEIEFADDETLGNAFEGRK